MEPFWLVADGQLIVLPLKFLTSNNGRSKIAKTETERKRFRTQKSNCPLTVRNRCGQRYSNAQRREEREEKKEQEGNATCCA